MRYTYCSFAEPGKFLGGLFLPGEMNAEQAAKTAWFMNLNPGGEIAAMIVEPKHDREEEMLKLYVGRLLTRDEVEEFDGRMSELMREIEPDGDW